MTPAETLQQHQQLCDDLYQLAVEENRFLKQNQRLPDQSLLERKRSLLTRLETSLSAIKALSAQRQSSPPDSGTDDGVDPAAVEKARSRILQILHLDRENEQLLFRYSLSTGPKTPPPTPPPSQLQRLYDRHAK